MPEIVQGPSVTSGFWINDGTFAFQALERKFKEDGYDLLGVDLFRSPKSDWREFDLLCIFLYYLFDHLEGDVEFFFFIYP